MVPCWLPRGGHVRQTDQSEYALHQPKYLVQEWADVVLGVFSGHDMWPVLGLLKSENAELDNTGEPSCLSRGQALN